MNYNFYFLMFYSTFSWTFGQTRQSGSLGPPSPPNPTNLTNPTNLSNPTNSTNPPNLSNPTNLTNPTNLSNPTNLTNPTNLSNPSNPPNPSNMSPSTKRPTFAAAPVAQTFPTFIPSNSTFPTQSRNSDRNPLCCLWARQGECDRNPFWMRPNCPQACGTPYATVSNAQQINSRVSPTCFSNQQRPNSGFGGGSGSGSGSGFSDSNSANFGSGCANFNPACNFWAENAQCLENRGWMAKNCAAACRIC